MIKRVENFIRYYSASTLVLGALFLLAVLCVFMLSSSASWAAHPKFNHTENYHQLQVSDEISNDTFVISESEAAQVMEARSRKKERHLRDDIKGHTRHIYFDFFFILIYTFLIPGVAYRFGTQKLSVYTLISVGLLAPVDILENAYILYQLGEADAWLNYPGPEGGLLNTIKWIFFLVILFLLFIILLNRFRTWQPDLSPEIQERRRRYISDRWILAVWNPLRGFLLFTFRASIFGLICYGILSFLDQPNLPEDVESREHAPLIVMYVLYSGLMAGIAFAALAVLLRFMELFLGEASGDIRQFMGARVHKLLGGKRDSETQGSDARGRGALFDGSGILAFQKLMLIIGATVLGGFTLYQIVRQNPYIDTRHIQLNNSYQVKISTEGGGGPEEPRPGPDGKQVPADLTDLYRQLGDLNIMINKNSRYINEQKKDLLVLDKKARADEQDIKHMIGWLRSLQNEVGAHRNYSIQPQERKW